MRVAYCATDTKLDRDVALMVQCKAFTEDPDRLTRPERYAKIRGKGQREEAGDRTR